MFEEKTAHICSIAEENSRSYLPILTPIDPLWERIKRRVKKWILVTEMNPQAGAFFRNTSRIIDERKKQVASGSWVIHPFSTFRLFYEIYMTVIYFLTLLLFPFHAAYGYLSRVDVFKNILVFFAYIDIIFNFLTGCVWSQETIIMKQSEVIRRYLFGIYFITDVLSSIPDTCDGISTDHWCDLSPMFALLKIIRLITFLTYLERSLTYFKLHGFKKVFIKVSTLVVVILNFTCCFLYCAALLYYSAMEQTIITNTTRFREDLDSYESPHDFVWNNYFWYFYGAASYLLATDRTFRYRQPWFNYSILVGLYFVGKILVVFATVYLVEALRNPYLLEVKYHSMMSQIDSFLETHQCPLALQNKIRHFYHYKYRERYLNEPRIEKLLSEKLKKEIRYHDCLKLIQNVQIFEQIPEKILEDVLTQLKKEIYMSNDYIIKAGTHGDGMYFLASGTVSVFSPAGKEIGHLQDGDYFGEIALLVPKAKRCATIIALEICEVYKMDRKTFRRYISTNTELFKQIQTEAKRRYLETEEIEGTVTDLRKSQSKTHFRH